ncbi:MAG: hypothetical protein AB8G23_13330 [Myxococcota bacterium]
MKFARAIALGVAISGSALSGFAGSASAANFVGLRSVNPNVESIAIRGLNARGDQAVGRAVSTNSGETSPFSYGEDAQILQDTSFLQPAGANGLEAIATGQQSQPGGAVRWTVGHITEGPATARSVFVAPQGAGPSFGLPKFPTAASAMISLGIGGNGNVIGRYTNAGGSGNFFFNASTSTYTDLTGIRAEAISATGARVVGRWNVTPANPVEQAIIWTESGGMTPLGALAPAGASTARGISAAGRIVVGASESGNLPAGQQEAFRWHPDLGMHTLDPIVGGASRQSLALASSDANSVVGTYIDGGATRAFIWTPVVGRMDMKEYLSTRHGLFFQLVGWTLVEASHISADGTIIAGRGINPQGEEDSWIVDLTEEDVAELQLIPVGTNDYQVVLECGDTPIRELYFGIILPQSMPNDGFFNFGDCQDDTVSDGDLYCTGASQIGSTVAQSSFVTVPDGEPAGAKRGDTVYVHLEGAGGGSNNLLCEPGDGALFLADFQIEVDIPPHLVFHAREGVVGLDDSGLPIPESGIRLIREPALTDTRVYVRPAVGDTTGTRFSVSMSSELALARFSFGITLPPNAATVSFGDCNENIGSNGRRGCADGLELGSTVDFDGVRIIGPSQGLQQFDLRTDSLYVYVEGNLGGASALPGINLPNQQVLLGYFTFDEPPPGAFAFVPTAHFEQIKSLDEAWGGDVNDWTDTSSADVQTISLYSSTGYGGGEDPDLDLDGIENADDRCPYVPSAGNLDNGTLEQPFSPVLSATEPDYIGNECQCGDAINSNTVISPDIELLRDALNDPSVAATIPPEALAKCNSIGPVMGVIDQETQLPIDCNLNDVFALIKGRLGAGPLIATPGGFPVCPDAMTP